MLAIAQRLGLESIVDRHVPPGQQEVGVGRYLLLAAINRVVAPKSKAEIGAWYDRTVLRRLWGLPASHFTSQRFWQAMTRIDDAALQAIELDLVRAAVSEFDVQVQGLIYDATNFYTYINTRTPTTLPARGHNKQKRNDLRRVNLALLTTADGHVPLLHETYQGNVPDSKEFGRVYTRLVARCRAVAGDDADVTLVFDKGNNSHANLEQVASERLHFVSSVVPSQHKDVLAVPLVSYQEVNPARWPGLLAHRLQCALTSSDRLAGESPVWVASESPMPARPAPRGMKYGRGRQASGRPSACAAQVAPYVAVGSGISGEQPSS